MQGLLPEIILKIIHRLPYIKVFEFSNACKLWYDIIYLNFWTKTLIICYGPIIYDREWFKTGEPIRLEQSLCVKDLFSCLTSPNMKTLFQNLIRLNIFDEKTEFIIDLFLISFFAKIEQKTM